MAEGKQDQERTEEPTARKLEQAREEGNIDRSTELSSVMILIVTVAVATNTGAWIYSNVDKMFKVFFMNAHQGIKNEAQALDHLQTGLMFCIKLTAPIFLILLITAILVNVAQTGMVFSTKKMEMKADRLNPVEGIKKLFSMRGAVELIKGFSKIFIVGVVIYFTLQSEIDTFTHFVTLPLGIMLSQTGRIVLLLITRILSALLILSIMDALYNRYQHRKDLRMTKQEVKDEHKQHEGDPLLKQKRRQRAMEFSRKRLDHAILKSNAVVTNPVHYAVALQYTPGEDHAPVVTAKGSRKRAHKIKELAQKYDIPVIENPPVARALYATAEEDKVIPPTLYKAVAEILAYVYQLKKRQL